MFEITDVQSKYISWDVILVISCNFLKRSSNVNWFLTCNFSADKWHYMGHLMWSVLLVFHVKHKKILHWYGHIKLVCLNKMLP